MIAWRQHRKLERTLYLQRGPEPSSEDEFIGIMETPELAALVVEAVRRVHEDWRAPALNDVWVPRRDDDDRHEDPLRVAECHLDDHYLCAILDGGSATVRVSVLDLNLYYRWVP